MIAVHAVKMAWGPPCVTMAAPANGPRVSICKRQHRARAHSSNAGVSDTSRRASTHQPKEPHHGADPLGARVH
jgi:hypothetical protein